MKIAKYIDKLNYTRPDGSQFRTILARLPLIKNGEYIRHEGPIKSFTYLRHKTWKAAIEAATQYRNAYLTEHGRMDLLHITVRRKGVVTQSKYNTSGAIGVVAYKNIHKNTTYYCYQARWQIQGNPMPQSKSFSWLKYTKKRAFQLACEKRYEQCGDIIITNRKLIPCLPNVPYLFIEAMK